MTRFPDPEERMVDLDVGHPLWDRFFWVAPLVLVGTLEEDGAFDLAPKHMAMPMGWQNLFGFVCTPRHGTYVNARREGGFAVSWPGPGQLVQTSLAAAPRENGDKPSVAAFPVEAAAVVPGAVVPGACLQMECELERIVDGFGDNSLIVGRVVAARGQESVLRDPDRDDADLIRAAPVLAYLHPGRLAFIGDTQAFPFPAGMRK